MSDVGHIYTNTVSNKQYKCIANITISPTLINDRETKFGVWKQIFGISGENNEAPKTIVLEDEDGNQIIAVLVDEQVFFDATANDIREGKTAVTENGVTIGEKYIPSYHTSEGYKIVLAGETATITNLAKYDLYNYTKFLGIVSLFNTEILDSVSSEIVSIDDNVYNVRSTEPISKMIKDHDNKIISLGITNNFDVPCIVRYITFKEVE